MKKSPRVEFHRAVYDNLSIFIKVLSALEKNPEVVAVYNDAPDAIKDGRTLSQMVLDDTLDVFATIMRDIPDDDVPRSFYRQILNARDPGKYTLAQADAHLDNALAEKRAQPDGAEFNPPQFMTLLSESLSPAITQMFVRNWIVTISNISKLTMNDQAIITGKKTAEIVEKAAQLNSELFMRTFAQNQALQNLSGNAGDSSDEDEAIEEDSLEKLARRVRDAGMSPEADKRARKELTRLSQINPQSSEYSVVFTYVDWLASLPWSKSSDVNLDVDKTQEALDEDHYGLQKVKEAIVEHIAVQNHTGNTGGKILCVVGPPGTGKTSIAKSVAKATGREYVRMSLGGVDDEAEIRGHRSTYVGAKPGRIIQAMKTAGTNNPLIVLDEIDKMGHGGLRGDPTAAMLEVLDPAQNNTFRDNYLDVDYDLSKVMFFCTANYFQMIPPALADRLEIVHIGGYTKTEKFEIGKRYLLTRQMEVNGLSDDKFSITDEAMRKVISDYTREAGVRNLEQKISRLCRKAVVQISRGKADRVDITADNLADYLGASRVRHDRINDADMVGHVNGLAYTGVGGVVLPIQTVRNHSNNGFRLNVTGNLGKVMSESTLVATSLIKSRAAQYGISQEKLDKTEMVVHAPDGSTPKDGPSAGLAMVTVILSSMTGIKIRRDVAMTGEVDLHGNALPIGGLGEKLEGALNAGVKTVIIPRSNLRDIDDVPEEIKSKLEIIPVDTIDDVLKIAFCEQPKPLPATEPGVPTKAEMDKVFNYVARQYGIRVALPPAANDTAPAPTPRARRGRSPG